MLMFNPLAVDSRSASKGFWSDVLGVGDFYFELAVQLIEICLQNRPLNGGLINLETLLSLLRKKRGKDAQAIVADDVVRPLPHPSPHFNSVRSSHFPCRRMLSQPSVFLETGSKF